MKQNKKMLGSINSPCVIRLMRLIETQSKETIVRFCENYVTKNILPIYEKAYPNDLRPREALAASILWMDGKIKFPEAKKKILIAHEAAREAEENPAAQAAARACGQGASTIHMPSHSLGIVFYGIAAIAYDSVGLNASKEIYDNIYIDECKKIENAFKNIMIENESSPAKIKWRI